MMYSPVESMAKQLGYLQDRSLQDVYRRTNMHFVAGDFSFDYLIPTTPNLVSIGGINAAPAKSLEPSFESFMQNSKDKGVVVISFGSLVKKMRDEEVDMIVRVMNSLPYYFVWKLVVDRQLNIGNNVKISEWIPQNDLLGHNKTVAFVSHGGNNGLWEAVYHGVPTIVLSMGSDGPGNGEKIAARGMGLWAEFGSLNSENLKAMLIEVIENKNFTKSARYISMLYHSNDMTVREKVIFWTNYLLKTNGAEHLIPPSTHLNFVQYYLIDVVAFLLLLMITFVFITVFVFRTLVKLYRVFFRNAKSKRD